MIREEALRWLEEGENDITAANILLETKFRCSMTIGSFL